MKPLMTFTMVFLCMSASAQIKVKFQKDGVYWNNLGDKDAKLANPKFDTVVLDRRIPKGDMVYWSFKLRDTVYYTTDGMIYQSDGIDSVENRIAIDKEKANKIHLRRLSEQRHQNLIKKYGKEYGELIYSGSVRIGMTKDMAISSWGKPQSIHRTIIIGSITEQWVYNSGNFLYFTNGRLSGIQN
jgi:hypothetical protein